MRVDQRHQDSDNGYGTCECGVSLAPVWFTEYEKQHGIKIDRKRRACSHLI